MSWSRDYKTAGKDRLANIEDGIESLTTGGSSSPIAVAQTTHGLSVGQQVRCTGVSTWLAAAADAASHADVDGVVTAVADVNNFTVTPVGPLVTVSGRTPGADQFLDTASGAITETEPSTAGQVSVPIGKAISATQMIYKPQRGLVIPSSAISYIPIQVGSESAVLAAGEGIGHWTITPREAGKSLVVIGGQCSVAPSTTGYNFQIRKGGTQAGVGGTDVLSTALTIDTTKVTSDGSATQPVIKSDGSQVAALNDVWWIDCDQGDAGNGRGATVVLGFQ